MDETLVPQDLRKQYAKNEILEIEQKHIIPAVGHYYEDPILIVDGKGATI